MQHLNMPKLGDELMVKANALIGTKIAGEWKEASIEIGGRTINMRNQKVFTEAYEFLEAQLGINNFRVIFNGGMYTQDIRMNRLNLKIDNDFIITEIYVG